MAAGAGQPRAGRTTAAGQAGEIRRGPSDSFIGSSTSRFDKIRSVLYLSRKLDPFGGSGDTMADVPTSAQQVFDMMPSRFNAAAASGVNATYQFDLTGDNGGTWQVAVANGTCAVSQG